MDETQDQLKVFQTFQQNRHARGGAAPSQRSTETAMKGTMTRTAAREAHKAVKGAWRYTPAYRGSERTS